MSRRSLLTVPAALGLASLAAGQSLRLNGPLVQPLSGDVGEGYCISADGTRVAYVADQWTDDVFELVGARLDGVGAPLRLNAPLPPNGDVRQRPQLAAGDRVLYFASANTSSHQELYSVPIDGSAPAVKLNGPLAPDEYVWLMRTQPSWPRVVFATQTGIFSAPVDGSAPAVQLTTESTGFLDVDGTGEVLVYPDESYPRQQMLRVPVDGSAAPTVVAQSSPPQPNYLSYFEHLTLSNDGLEVVYFDVTVHELGFDQTERVFSLRLDGSRGPTQLSLAPSERAPFFSITPDGTHVVYVEQGNGGTLYSVGIDGSDRVALTAPGVAAGFFFLAPDGARAAWFADGALMVGPIDGSEAPIEVSTSEGILALSPQFSPDGALLAYLDFDFPTSFRALYAVSTAGGTPALLNGPIVPGGRGAQEFALDTAGVRVVFVEDREIDDVFVLASSPLDGATPAVRLCSALDGGRDVASFAIAPDATRVVYRADETTDETFELFACPIDGAAPPFACNDPLASGPVLGDVLGFQATADGAGALYRADETDDELVDLYAVELAQHGEPVRLTAALAESGDVLADFVQSPDGERVVFQFLANDVHHLYVVPRSGAEPPLELDSSVEPFPAPFAITADGSRAVYRRRGLGFDLVSVALDGGPPITLHAPTGVRTVEQDFALTPDGASVVYRADGTLGGVFELHVVRVDGSTAPVRLNPALPFGRDVDAFAIAPDGQRVVYVADVIADNRFELWSVALDGSGAPRRLNGPLVAGGDVTDFRFSPDARWVYFRADSLVNDTFELFRSPVTGRRPPVRGPSGELRADPLRLTPLAAGRSVLPGFRLAPDGSALYFVADGAASGVFELQRVAAGGTTPPVVLSQALTSGGDVTDFDIAPDGTRLVYRANARADEVFELFTVPALGGPALALAELPGFADVSTFRIAPDSLHVAWIADREVDERNELHRSAIDGSAPPARVHRALPPAGDVQPDFVPLAGGRVLFRTDLDQDEVLELFLGVTGVERAVRHASPTRAVTR